MNNRHIIRDGIHTQESLNVLSNDIGSGDSLHAIAERSARILGSSVDPIAGSNEPSYGLLYGLIQSGKTSIITVTAAMAADNGFKCIVILTSDINPLYSQTLQRIRSHLRGLRVLGKSDWNNAEQFERQIRSAPFVIVCSKNGGHLSSLIEAFKKVGSAGARGLPTMVIDDEADQASLNTYTQKNAQKRTAELSTINRLITELRGFFQTCTYLQATATPQALFLQGPDGLYRPSFTILSEPGPGYVGGEAFFGDESKLLKYVDLDEVDELRSGHQPSPTHKIPEGLKHALLSFFVAGAAKNILSPKENFSFLCHISHTKIDHGHIVSLADAFAVATVSCLKGERTTAYEKLEAELREEYEDLSQTEPGLPPFEKIVERIAYLLPAASIKEINSNSDETITPDHPYSIFVGGNKLGRGVTIPNLITSYYGRNPKKPNADTVLQHARMYGYRQSHLGVTRLFLPEKLAEHFRIIHQMENALRDLVTKYPTQKFEGIYIGSPLRATRSNVLDANSIGVYAGGKSYNPRYPLISKEVAENTNWLDQKLAYYGEEPFVETDIATLVEILEKCRHDPSRGAELWNGSILKTGLEVVAKVTESSRAYLRVRRGRDIAVERRETQGILTGGEDDEVPKDAPTLFIL